MFFVKRIARLRRLHANFTSRHPQPASVAINITGLCNLHCQFCERSRHPSGASLSLDRVIELLGLASSLDAPVYLGGGEPTLHPDFWAILEAAVSLRVELSVSTNGTGLGRLTAGQEVLLSRAVSNLLVSLDAGSAAEHDAIRGREGLFAEVEAYLRSPGAKPRLAIASVLRPDLANVSGILELAAVHRLPVVFQMMIVASNFPGLARLPGKSLAAEEMRNTAEAAGREVRELAVRARSLGVRTNLARIEDHLVAYYGRAGSRSYFGPDVLPRYVCSVPFQRMTVDEAGTIQPCVLLPGSPGLAGADPLRAWQIQAVAMRERLLAGEVFAPCSACACHTHDNYLGSLLRYPGANRAAWRRELQRKIRR
ncbi:MAG: radical SAM protein [Candidatus Krumholzibacteriia bacterium]